LSPTAYTPAVSVNIDPFLAWVESTALSQWIIGSPSMFAFPGILTLHAIGMGFAVGCGRVIGSAGGGVGFGAGVSRAGATSAAGRDVVSSTRPLQGRAIMKITTSTATPLNTPSASGRSDPLRGLGATSCFFADDPRSGAARGVDASSQAATSGGDGGNSVGRPRAVQKS